MRSDRAKDAYAFFGLFWLWDGDGMRDLLSWWGFSAGSLLLLAGGIVICVQEGSRFRALLTRTSTLPLLGFMAVCLISVAWSDYRLGTLIGIVIQLATTTVAFALILARPVNRLISIFALMIQTNLALSLVFEMLVPLLPRHELMPFFTNYPANSPGAFAWSQGLLYTGQRIQGIVGNANLTSFLALLGIITVLSLLAAHRIRTRLAVAALVLDALMFVLTRSATVIIAAVIVAAVAGLVLGYRRVRGRGRIILTIGALAVIGLAALSSSSASEPVLHLLGKGDDLTGRLEIWRVVGGLVAKRPIVGWGWISWWAPWLEPFKHLVVFAGVEYLQAHNAYLDVEFQLGVIGLVAFVVLLAALIFRAVRLAAVRAPMTLLPLLLVTALLTQALAESRLLIEGNWALLAALSIALPWGRHHIVVAPEEGLTAQEVLR